MSSTQINVSRTCTVSEHRTVLRISQVATFERRLIKVRSSTKIFNQLHVISQFFGLDPCERKSNWAMVPSILRWGFFPSIVFYLFIFVIYIYIYIYIFFLFFSNGGQGTDVRTCVRVRSMSMIRPRNVLLRLAVYCSIDYTIYLIASRVTSSQFTTRLPTVTCGDAEQDEISYAWYNREIRDWYYANNFECSSFTRIFVSRTA